MCPIFAWDVFQFAYNVHRTVRNGSIGAKNKRKENHCSLYTERVFYYIIIIIFLSFHYTYLSRYTVLFNWNNHNIILREKLPSTTTVGRRQ
jgi:hypothetical protein